jgi:hypothetical protein
MLAGTLAARAAPPWQAPWFARPAAHTGERRAIVVGGGPAARRPRRLAARMGRRGARTSRRHWPRARHRRAVCAPSPHPTALTSSRSPDSTHRAPCAGCARRPRLRSLSRSSPATSMRQAAVRRWRSGGRCFARWTARRLRCRSRRAGCSSLLAGCTAGALRRCSTIRVSSAPAHDARDCAVRRAVSVQAALIVAGRLAGSRARGLTGFLRPPSAAAHDPGQITLVRRPRRALFADRALRRGSYRHAAASTASAPPTSFDRGLDIRASVTRRTSRASAASRRSCTPRSGSAGSTLQRSRASRVCAARARTTCR